MGRGSIERGRPEHHVGNGLGQYSPDAEHHTRAELRIAHHTGDEFAVAAHHRCHENRHVTVFGTSRREKFGRGGCHRGVVGETETHESAFGLVGDRVTAQLGHDRQSDLPSGDDRGIGTDDQPFGRHGHSVLGEQRFGRRLGEGA